jgi:spore photoproduct lyase
MIDVIYIEQSVRDHPRARAIVARFPAAQVIDCDHYGEIFNRHNQNFRAQKLRPALLLAEKIGRRILPVPDGYGLDGTDGYYFSHILNCLYDCRYCFLQGLFRSAHYVLFVNYEDFIADISDLCAQSDKPQWFFSGYDCDSLALEPISAFTDVFIAALNTIPNAWLELRSKSTQIRSLLDREPVSRVVCAFSLNPQPVIDRLEHRTPTLDARLAALRKLQQHGWPVALRFDPLILGEHFRRDYAAFFRHVFAQIDVDGVHSITLGSFRAPRAHFRRMADLYPDEKLFAEAFDDRQGQIGYAAATEREMLAWCQQQLAPLAGSVPVYLQSA